MPNDDANDRGTLENQAEIDDQVFTDAFEKAEKAELSPELNESDNPANQPEENQNAEPQDNKDNKEAIAPEPPDQPESPPTSAKNDDATFEQRWKSLQGIHKSDKEKWEAERQQLLSQIEEAKKSSSTPPEPDQKKETTPKQTDEDFLRSFLDSLTDEQKDSLKEYDEEFDIVSKMEGLKRDTAMKKLRADLLSEITKVKEEIASQLSPVGEFVEESKKAKEKDGERIHFESIRGAHPDFETYRDDGSILKWIESKPGYLQRGMIEAYTKGSAVEVIELLDGFKQENNIKTEFSQGSQGGTNNVVNMDARRQERKQAMTEPQSRKSAVNQSMKIADNYDDAFEEALHR